MRCRFNGAQVEGHVRLSVLLPGGSALAWMPCVDVCQALCTPPREVMRLPVSLVIRVRLSALVPGGAAFAIRSAFASQGKDVVHLLAHRLRPLSHRTQEPITLYGHPPYL